MKKERRRKETQQRKRVNSWRTCIVIFGETTAGEPLHFLVGGCHLRVLDDARVQVRGAALAEARQEEVRDTADLVLAVKARVFTLLDEVQRTLMKKETGTWHEPLFSLWKHGPLLFSMKKKTDWDEDRLGCDMNLCSRCKNTGFYSPRYSRKDTDEERDMYARGIKPQYSRRKLKHK